MLTTNQDVPTRRFVVSGLNQFVADYMIFWFLANLSESHGFPTLRDVFNYLQIVSLLGLFGNRLRLLTGYTKTLVAAWLALAILLAAIMFLKRGVDMSGFAVPKWRFAVAILFTCFSAYAWYLAIHSMPPGQQAVKSGDAAQNAPVTFSSLPAMLDTVSPPATQRWQGTRRFSITRYSVGRFFSGSNLFTFDFDANGNSQPIPLLFLFKGGTVQLTNGLFVINGSVTDGKQIVKIVDNQIQCPPGWDANEDAFCTEIVNEQKFPVFQIICYKNAGGDRVAAIAGVFVSEDGSPIAVHAMGPITDISSDNINSVLSNGKAIFNYPSDVFAGARSGAVPPSQP